MLSDKRLLDLLMSKAFGNGIISPLSGQRCLLERKKAEAAVRCSVASPCSRSEYGMFANWLRQDSLARNCHIATGEHLYHSPDFRDDGFEGRFDSIDIRVAADLRE